MAHRLSPEAERDLDDIAYAIARASGSLAIAERLIDSIAARFHLLAEHPRVGRARDDLFAGARSFPVGNYIIVYGIDGEDVQILRIIHGRRNITALFGG
ncbi:MAG: type II toxin-antitoxin system RelE/ParE family toxin [Nevskiales bacterium]